MISYRRYTAGHWEEGEKSVPRELHLNLEINGRELASLAASPGKLTALVVGFLYNEGMIDSPADISLLQVCEEDGLVRINLNREVPSNPRRIFTSVCGRGVSLEKDINQLALDPAPITVSPAKIFLLMRELFQRAADYRASGGLHASGLSDGNELLLMAEDVGRHNTVDKLCGEALLSNLPLAGKWILTTGRLSSEMVIKAAKMRCPLLISRTSPTDWAVKLALQLHVGIIGYVRGESFHSYTLQVELAPDR